MSKLKSLLYVTPTAANTAWALFLLRVSLAFFMLPHGYNKLNNLIVDNASDFPDPIGVGPTASMVLTIFAEFFCSIFLLLGLFTRFATLTLIICMLVIAFVIHWSDPLGDKEHALLYGFGYLTVFLAGPGKFALDDRLR